MTDYLAKNFPERPAPDAVVIPGSVEVSIKEWQVPTAGSRPHDPAFAPDGSVWYTGQMANVLGRFDPKTQQFKEYTLKTPGSGPHGLVPDKDGNIWFTANFKAYIGKLDPKTGNVTEYPMPDPQAKDPHTLLFAPNGNIYFTVQGGNMVGRLNPKTGEVKVVNSPTLKSNPYGMVVSSKGVPFFVEFGSNKVASLDPDTLAIHEYVLPHVDSHPRRVAITPDDVIWYSDYSRGYLGTARSQNGQSHRVGVSWRAAVETLRHHGGGRRHLVQRIEHQAEYRRALRSRRRKNFRRGLSLPAEASCGTWCPLPMAICGSRAAV